MHRLRRGVFLSALVIVLFCAFALLAIRAAVANRKTGSRAGEDFSALRYPYQQLTAREQRLYDALYSGISDFETTIKLPGTFTTAEYERVYLMVLMQEPTLFYVQDVYELADEMHSATIYYSMSQEEAKAMGASLDFAASQIVNRLSSTQSEWQQLLMIHDLIAAGCEYGKTDHSSDAYGCLCEGAAQCEGYAKAFLYVARSAGLQVMCVPGQTDRGTNHVWNVAEIDGAYYNIDVTWDDDDAFNGSVVHCCFAVPDASFHDHTPDTISYIPPTCTDSSATYYQKHGYVLSELPQLEAQVQNWMGQQTGAMTEFRWTDQISRSEVQLSLVGMFSERGYRVIMDDDRQVAVILG